MSDEEYAGLRDSIDKDGVLEPICLLDGKILDGWHRYKAANETNRECPHFTLAEHADPRDYVIAKNKHRRNLTPSQVALSVAEVMGWKKPWRPSDEDRKTAPGAALTTPQMADLAGVGERTMRHAKAVVRHASPEVKEAVRDGIVSVKKAAEVATLPKNEQVVALVDSASAPAVALKRARAKAAAGGEEPIAFDDTVALHAKVAELEMELDGLREKNAEQSRLLDEINADLEAANKVIEAEAGAARIKAALEEARRFREAHRQLEDRQRGLMAEKAEAVRAAQTWQRRAQANGRATRH